MRKTKKILAMILICAMLLPFAVMDTNAETGTESTTSDNGAYLYKEDFSGSTSDMISFGWSELVAGFNVADGKLKTPSGYTAPARWMLDSNSEALKWSNYIAEVDITIKEDCASGSTLTSGAGGRTGGIFVGSTTTENKDSGYRFEICRDRRHDGAGSGTNDDRFAFTDSVYSGKYSWTMPLSDVFADERFAFDTSYRLKVVVYKNMIGCYCNDVLIRTITINEVEEVKGSIGFRGTGHVWEFDNLSVRSTEFWYGQNFVKGVTIDDLSNAGWTNTSSFVVSSKRKLESTVRNQATVFNVAGSENWSDYTVEAKATITSKAIGTGKGKAASIYVGVQNGDYTTSYGFRIRETYADDGTVKARFWTFMNGSTEVKSNNYEIYEGQEYTLKLVVNGKSMSAFIDGQYVGSYEVENDIQGTIALEAGQNAVTFDDVSIRPNGVLYEQNFDNATIEELSAAGWTDTNNFSINSDKKLESTVRNAVTVLDAVGSETWANYTLEAKATITSNALGTAGGRPATIYVGVQDADYTAAYGFRIRETYKDGVVSNRYWTFMNGSTEVKIQSYEINEDQEYALKLVVNGNNMSAFIDGKRVGTYEAESNIQGTIALQAGNNVVTFDDILVCPHTYREDYFNASAYRNGTANLCPPSKEGKVFSGWYTDAALTTPFSADVKTGNAYAKFIDEDVLSVKAQLDANTKAASDTEKTRMRFVTTVDCLEYQKVGFIVSTLRTDGSGNPIGKSQTFESTTVYSALNAQGLEVPYTPKDISSDSKYFATMILGNLSATESDLNKVFTVTPFWVTPDGTTVTGITRDAGDENPITIQNGIAANNKNNGNSSEYSLR